MIETARLDSGLRVVTERMADVRSVTLGIWVGTGSRDEAPELSGASHFLEHLLFKGTETRSAKQIAEDVESVGGDLNAFTTKEHTAFYVRVLDDDLDLALGILGDIMREPALRADDVEAERQVILEELLMHTDEPSDGVHDLLHEIVFADHGLGREVLGTDHTIEALTRDEIADFFGHHYRPANIVVAAAGRLDHDDVVARASAIFGGERGEQPTRSPVPAVRGAVGVTSRDTEQAHVVIGTPGLPAGDDDRFALSALNHILGGGTASRLFQEVREKRGLAYSVYSYWAGYTDTGIVAVYAGTAPARLGEVLECVTEQLDLLVEHGPTERELAVARGHLRGALALALEDSGARMNRIGSSLLTLGRTSSVEEVVARSDAVTVDDVAAVAKRLLGGSRSIAVIGPGREDELRAVAFPFCRS